MNTRTMPRTKTRRGPAAPRVPDEEPVVVSPEPLVASSPLKQSLASQPSYRTRAA